MAASKAKSPSGGVYRYVGDHAIILESGAPLAVGDYITLDEISPAMQELIDEGKLLDASGVEVPSVEASTTPDDSSTAKASAQAETSKTTEGSGE